QEILSSVLYVIAQVEAVKNLARNRLQGNREFLIEVLTLSLLHNKNMVNLIGYYAEGDQRILVYKCILFGSLEDHLLDLPSNKKPLDWSTTRMKKARGAAKGPEYLQDTANTSVICHDFKASNILFAEEFNPKLSDFRLAKLRPIKDKSYVSTRVMGTYGYCVPEYALIGNYPIKGLYQAPAIAAMCLQEEAGTRPLISDVVSSLEYLAIPQIEERVFGAKIEEVERSWEKPYLYYAILTHSQ
ncbi:hypothetical protein GIB67_040629, partial [Kingdonia uniflora]